MTSPILNSYTFILNKANNYSYKQILIPPFTNLKAARVISNVSDLAFIISCFRDSYFLEGPGLDVPVRTISGLVVPSEYIYYPLNSNVISTISAKIYENPYITEYPEQITITLQFI